MTRPLRIEYAGEGAIHAAANCINRLQSLKLVDWIQESRTAWCQIQEPILP